MKTIQDFLNCFYHHEDHGNDKYCVDLKHLRKGFPSEFEGVLGRIRDHGFTRDSKAELESLLGARFMSYALIPSETSINSWCSREEPGISLKYNHYFIEKNPELYKEKEKEFKEKTAIYLMYDSSYREGLTKYLVQEYGNKYDVFICC